MSAKTIISDIYSLLASGPILPGGIKTQFSVCGKSGCQCTNTQNPKKHGPYNKLSYGIAGKDSSMFIKGKNLSDAEKMVERFQMLKKNLNLLALECVTLCRENNFDEFKKIYFDKLQFYKSINDDRWKRRALLRQETLLSNKVKIRDLEKSRNKWKQKALERNDEIMSLKSELRKNKRLINKKK
jgi:hypothetical protein